MEFTAQIYSQSVFPSKLLIEFLYAFLHQSELAADGADGCIKHLIVPEAGCICGIFGHEKEYVIPFGDVKQIGDDLILVEMKKPKDAEKPCKDGKK